MTTASTRMVRLCFNTTVIASAVLVCRRLTSFVSREISTPVEVLAK